MREVRLRDCRFSPAGALRDAARRRRLLVYWDLWGAVLHKLTLRARGVGCGPFGIGRGGAGSDLCGSPPPPACGERRGVATAAVRLATSTAWAMKYSWCPGGRRLQKPLSLFLRWAPRPRRPCRGVPKANEPACARSVDDGTGSGDPGTHFSGGEQR